MDAKQSPKEAAKTLQQRRADNAARARKNRDVIDRAIALRQHRAILHALEQIMIRGREFVLDSWAALQVPQVWAVDASGAVLGHVCTVALDVLRAAPDFLVAPLAAALMEPWSDPTERTTWTAAYVDALRRIAAQAETVERALQERAMLREVSGLDPDDGPPPQRRM